MAKDEKPVDSEEKLQPREWAAKKSLGTSLASRMVFDIATMLKRWPNPDLDPTFTLTEADFDAAIDAAGKM